MTVYTVFGQPASPASLAADTTGYTFGMEFSLSSGAALTGIWFYSAPAAGELPAGCVIYSVASTLAVTGTTSTSPSWSGAAGSGWVKCTYDGTVTLAASVNYKVAVYGASGVNWYAATAHYWDSGPGSGGITSGIITAMNNAGTDVGQDSYYGNAVALTYPNASFNATSYWLDVEVTTGGPPPAAPAVLYSMRSFP